MIRNDPSLLDPSLVIETTGADPEFGLSSAEAARRRGETGPNELDSVKPVPRWQTFAEQFRDPLIYLLVAAVVISSAAWAVEGASGWPVDAIVIVSILVLNGALGYFQQTRAERSLRALRKLGAASATVVRDGARTRIAARDLVPGDLLLLAAGDLVAADARVLSSRQLELTEASLSGVSEPVPKQADVDPAAAESDRGRTMVFSGTAVTRGTGRAVVTATGTATRIGGIAALVHARRATPSPLQREIAQVGRMLGRAVTVITIVVVAAILLITGVHGLNSIVTALLFGLSLAVAAVPEGLPAILAVVLALGVRRMANHHAIVKNLASVEALGSASVICSGKTGTLTDGSPKVERVISPCGEVTLPALEHPRAGSGAGEECLPAPTRAVRQAALVLGLGSLGSDTHLGEQQRRGSQLDGQMVAFRDAQAALGSGDDIPCRLGKDGELAASLDHPLLTTLEPDHAGNAPAITTGPPDALVEHCDHVLIDQRVELLDQHRRNDIKHDATRLADSGFRTVAVAYRSLAQASPVSQDELREPGLVYTGMVGLIDPPRPEVVKAIGEARRAGVRVIMITGDHRRTALPLARRLGMTNDSRAVSGTEIDELDDDQLRETVRRCSIYPAVTPEQKLRIIGALQANHDVVAVTGTGVNDAPAVKSADVGVAMGQAGAEATKESAKIILADDNFATVVEAIREGRGIFSNIKKFLRYLISSNIGEVLTVFLGVILAGIVGLTDAHNAVVLPLLATQLLWINLLTDGTPALALGVDPETDGLMKRPPRPLQDRVVDRSMWRGSLLIGLTMALATLATLDLYLPGGLIAGHETLRNARTAGFTVLVLAQMFNTLNARSEHASAFHRLFTNRWLWAAIALSTVLQVAVVEIPVLNIAFTTSPLSWSQWLVCTAMASTVLWVSETWKLVVGLVRHWSLC